MARILIVDDSKFSILVLKKGILKRRPDWEITECPHATEAMNILRQQTHDLAIVDYNMPDINGLKLLEQMKQSYPTLKLILCTANIQDSIQKAARAIGVLGIANKPVNDEIMDRIIAIAEQ